jgi:hypothetical protein
LETVVGEALLKCLNAVLALEELVLEDGDLIVLLLNNRLELGHGLAVQRGLEEERKRLRE